MLNYVNLCIQILAYIFLLPHQVNIQLLLSSGIQRRRIMLLSLIL